jgi:trehalose 6-phosphate synthase
MFERLRAVERFFDRYPSWRERLVFCQIAVPSRTRVEEYRDMKRDVDTLVEKINARFGNGAWVPIRYLYRSFDPDELAVYYAAADVGVVTPLADGLSFVPYEYAAARTREDGSLVVSALAGAADALPEATVVNPHDEEAVAAAVHTVLEARPEEIRARMRLIRDRAREQSATAWLTSFWQSAFGEAIAVPATDALAVPREVAAQMEISAPI